MTFNLADLLGAWASNLNLGFKGIAAGQNITDWFKKNVGNFVNNLQAALGVGPKGFQFAALQLLRLNKATVTLGATTYKGADGKTYFGQVLNPTFTGQTSGKISVASLVPVFGNIFGSATAVSFNVTGQLAPPTGVDNTVPKAFTNLNLTLAVDGPLGGTWSQTFGPFVFTIANPAGMGKMPNKPAKQAPNQKILAPPAAVTPVDRPSVRNRFLKQDQRTHMR